MANHERDKALCRFFKYDGTSGCGALLAQRCANCNFFVSDCDYVRNKEMALEKFKKSKHYARLYRKYYDKTGGVNYEEEKEK